MAILATAIWEFQTTGNNDNGGGFDIGIASYGTDYSMQTTAQLSLTNLAMTTGGVIATSTTGGFTAAMIGNSIYIKSGTNFTAGWYFIITRTDTNTITLDRDATTGSNATGGVVKVGGSMAVPTDAFLEALTANNKVWIKSGNYTLGGTISIGTSTNITIVGYKTNRGDHPTGADRPVIIAAANTLAMGVGYALYHLEVTTTTVNGLSTPSAGNCLFYNCKVTNSSATASRFAIYLRQSTAVSCEAVSTNGIAITFNSANSSVFNCYMHDSITGLASGTSAVSGNVSGSVIDTCTTGILAGLHTTIYGNTLYNCSTVGVDTQAQVTVGIMQNIFHTCATGITSSSVVASVQPQYNLFYNCGTANTTGIDTLNSSNILVDPKLNAPATGDFTLQTGSPAISAGFPGTSVGLVGDYKINIGMCQDGAATSSGESSYTWLS